MTEERIEEEEKLTIEVGEDGITRTNLGDLVCTVPFPDELTGEQYVSLPEVHAWFKQVQDEEGRLPYGFFAGITYNDKGEEQLDVYIVGADFNHRGISGVPWWFVENIRQVTPEDIKEESNAEVRRLFMERLGLSNYIDKYRVLSKDNYGELWEAHITGEDKNVFVHILALENSTPETNKALIKDLKKKNMLGPNGGRMYYQFANMKATTAKEAMEYSVEHLTAFLRAAGCDGLPDEGFRIQT